MHARVGIPRAMGYYYFYPFYRGFLEALGAVAVLSPLTTMRTLARMETCPTDEPCLAVKLHFGHADALVQRADLDFLFLPIIARVGEMYCCPKFLGISDMLRHGLRLDPARVLAPVIDYSDDDDAQMLASLRPVAARLGVHAEAAVRRALHRGREEQARFRALCVSHRLTTPEAYRALDRQTFPAAAATGAGPATAVIGHPYILYELVSQGMIERLRAAGPVWTAEMVDPAAIADAQRSIPDGERLWPFEAQLVGAALHLMRTGQAERLILAGSFECGPTSIIEAYLEEEAHRLGIPFLLLALDEHSGDAGLATRLEAFMDTEKCAAPPLPAPPAPHLPTRGEMVVGFPSMGHLDTAVRTVIELCGARTLPTPRTTKQCVELGRALAPEFVCFPFIATLGQMRYLLDHGANTLLMVGGKQYCRLGWYAQVQEKLLRRMGYDFELIVIESPFPWRTHWGPFAHALHTITGGASWPRILAAMYTGYRQLQAIERAEYLAHRLRATERAQGTADRLLDAQLAALRRVRTVRDIRRAERDFAAAAAAVETEDTDPLRVRLVGEIWVVLEQSATRDIERWLGSRARPRVLVERPMSAGEWFDGHVLRRRYALQRQAEILAAAAPWLSQKVGGHGQITVGEAARAAQEGVDGLIHLFPFTCMPEIIAQNILVRLAETLDLPVLTYIVSEQTGEAGMETRLEAFLDVLEERQYARRGRAGNERHKERAWSTISESTSAR